MKAALRRGTYADLNIYSTLMQNNVLGCAANPAHWYLSRQLQLFMAPPLAAINFGLSPDPYSQQRSLNREASRYAHDDLWTRV